METPKNRNYYLKKMLDYIGDDLDKTQSSPIFPPISAVAYILSEFESKLYAIEKLGYIISAEGEYVDKRAEEFGYKRLKSTKAIKKLFLYDVNDNFIDSAEIGSRFSCGELSYKITKLKNNYYEATCEQEGNKGNIPTGRIINISGLGDIPKGLLGDIIIPARDTESDEAFKSRFFELINRPPFGGNKSDYIKKVLELEGVGSCKIVPVWNGGGTVKVIIQDSLFNPAGSDLIEYVQNEIDPQSEGLGRGLAPIGHKVTIVSATSVDIKIEAKITFYDGFNKDNLYELIKSKLEEYFINLRKFWYRENSSEIIYSRVLCVIANTDGIQDISELKINDDMKNIILESEQIPILKEFIIND